MRLGRLWGRLAKDLSTFWNKDSEGDVSAICKSLMGRLHPSGAMHSLDLTLIESIALSELANKTVTVADITAAINAMDRNCDSIPLELARRISDHQSRDIPPTEQKEWVFAAVTNLCNKHQTIISSFEFGNTVFRFCTKDTKNIDYKWAADDCLTDHNSYVIQPRHVLLFSSRGETFASALSNKSFDYTLFCGAMEFALSQGSFKLTFGGPGRTHKFVVGPKIYGKCGTEIVYDMLDYPTTTSAEERLPNSEDIKNSTLNNLEYISLLLKDNDVSTCLRNRIDRCLRLYMSASEQALPALRILNYWQICEILALSEPGRTPTKQIVNRMAWLARTSRLSETVLRPAISSVAAIRNQYVHAHDNEASFFHPYEIAIKHVVDFAIQYILVHAREIRDIESLRYIYEYKDIPHYRILAAENSLDIIKKLRSTS